MSYNTDCREIRVKRSGSASDLNLIILLERCLRGSSVVKLKRERGVLFALLLEKVYDNDIRKANESLKREGFKFKDLENVHLELNKHAFHPYAWWFSDGKENNTSDGEMQGCANKHDNDTSKAKKGLRQFVVERCIVVQLTDINQAEPAFYHFENGEYGGSDIHHNAVNLRTKKMLFQFDSSDAVARVIQYSKHKVKDEVVGVQKACAEDLKEFADCDEVDMNPSQGNEDEESEDEEDSEIDPTATLVIKLPESLLTAKVAIRLHFENEEYGGDDIKSLRLQPKKRRALVTFNNGKDVVDQVLSYSLHSPHTVCGTEVEVRRCLSDDLAD